MADIYSEIGNYCVGSSLGWQNLSPPLNIDIIRSPTLHADHSGLFLESLPQSFEEFSLFLSRTLSSDVNASALPKYDLIVFYCVGGKDLGGSSPNT